jgi:hypothetical protein
LKARPCAEASSDFSSRTINRDVSSGILHPIKHQ